MLRRVASIILYCCHAKVNLSTGKGLSQKQKSHSAPLTSRSIGGHYRGNFRAQGADDYGSP